MPLAAWYRVAVAPPGSKTGAAALINNRGLLAATGTVTPVVTPPVLVKVGHPFPRLEIDFAHDPGYTGTPTWTDLTSRIIEFHTKHGKQSELDQVEAGTATLVLDNRDGALDPMRTSSPYYPNVIPMRKARLAAEHSYDTTRRNLFTGFIEGIDPDYSAGWGNVPMVKISLIDVFEILNNINVGSVFDGSELDDAVLAGGTFRPTERSDQRIAWILDQAGIPSTSYSLEQGNVYVPAKAYNVENALSAIMDCVNAERGLFFSNNDGLIVFQNRVHRLLSTSNTHVLGNNGGSEIPYDDLGMDYDKSRIFNHAAIGLEQDSAANTATNVGEWIALKDVDMGTPAAQAEDATSRGKYLKRSFPNNSLFLTDQNQAQGVADYIVASYKDPRLRPRSVSILVSQTDAAQDAALSRDLSDRVQVIHRDPITGQAKTVDSYIESVEHQMGSDRVWKTTWDLSPVGVLEGQGFWVMNTSALGTTTRLFY